VTLAIMQPYLFPYIGYWQLIDAVDTFVIYDDVNYIKQGYINRNSILNRNKVQQFTLELIGASSNKLINEINIGNSRKKLLKTIELNYKKAPYFKIVFPIIQEVLMQDEKNLAKFIGYSLEKISAYLEIGTKFIYSSTIEKNNLLKGEEKILEICKKMNADKYINAIGGKVLYTKSIFKERDINLQFLETDLIEYKQFTNEFIPSLSIVDIMMFNSKYEIKYNILKRYNLI